MAHPIENIMGTTMENLKEMIDVSTVVGTPVSAGEGVTVIPVSRVSFGFVAGGGEYDCKSVPLPLDESGQPLPFAGGTGAGVTVSPVAFLMVSGEQVRLLPAVNATPIDRLVEMIPQIVRDVKDLLPEKHGVTEIHI
ncbi:MAG: GerW family sporulation protein [Candidatus Spyradocola sp.]